MDKWIVNAAQQNTTKRKPWAYYLWCTLFVSHHKTPIQNIYAWPFILYGYRAWYALIGLSCLLGDVPGCISFNQHYSSTFPKHEYQKKWFVFWLLQCRENCVIFPPHLTLSHISQLQWEIRKLSSIPISQKLVRQNNSGCYFFKMIHVMEEWLHCSLMTSYGDIDLIWVSIGSGNSLMREDPKPDLSALRTCAILLRANKQEMPQISMS